MLEVKCFSLETMPSHHPPIVNTTRPTYPGKLRPIFAGFTGTLALSCAALLLSGCGQTGTPQAPSLQLPTPVSDLAASRAGDQVTLTWTMPRRTTDKLPLKGRQPVQICRKTDNEPCRIVGAVSFEAGKPAFYDDSLPADLTSGPPRLLSYSIDLPSPHGRSAGASNLAYAAAGSAPQAFIHAEAQITANGVLLRWQPVSLAGTDHKVNIDRTLLSLPAPARSEAKPASQYPLGGSGQGLIKEQTLTVRMPDGADSGNALEPDAAFDQRYSYRISRVMTVSVDGKSLEVAGPSSADILVDTKDIFAPAAPVGLAAVAAPGDGAIDLSWTPNAEPDLAGYTVYRSESDGKPLRMSPISSSPNSSIVKLIDAPVYRDQTAQPGHGYTYSVTAIDRDGNESPHSAEVQETLPQTGANP